MAYMSQEKKSKIVTELKKVIPTGWKWSTSVENHRGIRLTIQSGPASLAYCPRSRETVNNRELNEYYLDREFTDPALVETFKAILAAMNLDNHDNSDPMTDYFDVGHYTYISIGRWNKPFVANS